MRPVSFKVCSGGRIDRVEDDEGTVVGMSRYKSCVLKRTGEATQSEAKSDRKKRLESRRPCPNTSLVTHHFLSLCYDVCVLIHAARPGCFHPFLHL
jgi:hypothetical protein